MLMAYGLFDQSHEKLASILFYYTGVGSVKENPTPPINSAGGRRSKYVQYNQQWELYKSSYIAASTGSG